MEDAGQLALAIASIHIECGSGDQEVIVMTIMLRSAHSVKFTAVKYGNQERNFMQMEMKVSSTKAKVGRCLVVVICKRRISNL